MPFIINVDAIQYTPGAYGGANTQCAALVQQGPMLDGKPHPPEQYLWRKGQHVRSAAPGQIKRGTVISTFTAAGTYPTKEDGNRHCGVYVSHDCTGIKIIDQWHPGKATPGQRTLKFTQGTPWSGTERLINKGDHYWVVEVDDGIL